MSTNCLIGYRTVLNANAAPGAEIHIDAARPFLDLHLEISRRSFHGFQIRVSDKFDIQMPADLDQFG